MSWAEKYLSIPFEDHGRGEGVDCWGLVMRVYRDELGIELPSFDDAYQSSHSDTAHSVIAREMGSWADWKEVDTPEPFDLVLMWGDYKEEPTHIGIVISDKQFLQASRPRVTAPLFQHRFWRDRKMGFWRYAGH